MIGRVVGNFRFTELLGEGGIGAVYAAVDQMLGRPVAIKLLRPELAHDTRFVERFRSEAASLARLNHPNITTLYSLHSEGGELLMIIELVEGRTLEDILRASGKLSVEECQAMAAQATEGFAYAHRMGVVHRDIKPANLMVTADGALKIMDFGIARIQGSQRMTRTGHIIGTLAYMAPEQIKGQEGDERSDIYSLGVVLYELLSGDPPFVADSEYQLIRAQVEETPRPLSERLPAIDPAIDHAVMRALSKEPADRFASMLELAQALGSTMALSTAKETMIRRVAPLVSQLAATRQRPTPIDPAGAGFGPVEQTPMAASSPSAPLSPQWVPPAPSPLEPAAAASERKRRLNLPLLLFAGAVVLFLAGVGFILKDTFFAAKPPPSIIAPTDAPKEPIAPSSPPAEPPADTAPSTDNPSRPSESTPPESPSPAPTPAPVAPPAPPSPAPPLSAPPLAPLTPGTLTPGSGAVEPKPPVEEAPSKPEKKTRKESKTPPKKAPSVAKDGNGGGSGSAAKQRSTPSTQSGSSGWSIQRN